MKKIFLLFLASLMALLSVSPLTLGTAQAQEVLDLDAEESQGDIGEDEFIVNKKSEFFSIFNVVGVGMLKQGIDLTIVGACVNKEKSGYYLKNNICKSGNGKGSNGASVKINKPTVGDVDDGKYSTRFNAIINIIVLLFGVGIFTYLFYLKKSDGEGKSYIEFVANQLNDKTQDGEDQKLMNGLLITMGVLFAGLSFVLSGFISSDLMIAMGETSAILFTGAMFLIMFGATLRGISKLMDISILAMISEMKDGSNLSISSFSLPFMKLLGGFIVIYIILKFIVGILQGIIVG